MTVENQMQVVRESADLSVLVPGLQRFSQLGDEKPVVAVNTVSDDVDGRASALSPSSNLARGVRDLKERKSRFREASQAYGVNKERSRASSPNDEQRVSSLHAQHHNLKANHNSIVEKLENTILDLTGKLQFLGDRVDKELDSHSETLLQLNQKSEETTALHADTKDSAAQKFELLETRLDDKTQHALQKIKEEGKEVRSHISQVQQSIEKNIDDQVEQVEYRIREDFKAQFLKVITKFDDSIKDKDKALEERLAQREKTRDESFERM